MPQKKSVTKIKALAKPDAKTAAPDTGLALPSKNSKWSQGSEPLFSQATMQMLLGYMYNNLLPNPDLIIRKSGINDEWRFYQEIECDDMVTTCINKIVRGVSSYKWYLTQDKSDPAIFDFYNEIFRKLTRKGQVRNTIKNIVKAICYGRQFINVKWEYDGSHWLPSGLDTYPIELFAYDIDGNIKITDGIVFSLINYNLDPPKYSILNSRNNPTLRNPYGESLLSKCYWLTFGKKVGFQSMNVMLEKYGMPWVITEYDSIILKQLFPDKEPSDAANEIVSFISNMVKDAILVTPAGLKSRFENVQNNYNTTNYKVLLDFCNEGISRIFTGHTATTMATPGKLGSNQDTITSDDFKAVINDQKENVSDIFNELIGWINEINFNVEEVPSFAFYEEEDINQDLAVRDALLVEKVGVRFNKSYIQKNYIDDEADFEVINIDEVKQAAPQQMQASTIKKLLGNIPDEIRNGNISNIEELQLRIKSDIKNIEDADVEIFAGAAIELARLQN